MKGSLSTPLYCLYLHSVSSVDGGLMQAPPTRMDDRSQRFSRKGIFS